MKKKRKPVAKRKPAKKMKSAAELKKFRQANLAKARAARALKSKTSPKQVKAKVDHVVGYTDEIYKPILVGRSYALLSADNSTIVKKLPGVSRARVKDAAAENMVFRAFVDKKGKTKYKLVEAKEFTAKTSTIQDGGADSVQEAFGTHEELKKFIHSGSIDLKPVGLFMEEVKWKYLIRSAVRGKNIMMKGPTGSGKTLAAQSLVKALKRPDFYFNLGASQDPRASLIGNTHFNKTTGTFFSESAFVKAIKTPNAIILLDELSRAHPEAWNILMTVVDQGQRYLRLDEAVDSPIVNVASGVTFVATANVGNEYTSTRVMDRALEDRFVTIEMYPLNKEDEYKLLKYKFPEASNYALESIAEIAHTSREMLKAGDGKLTTMVSTRTSVEAAGLVYDGFTLQEAAEIAVLPYFSNDGGLDSERVFMRQLVQKFVKSTDDELIQPAILSEDEDEDGLVKW
jgi:nitric oxide reductase NorQ protein